MNFKPGLIALIVSTTVLFLSLTGSVNAAQCKGLSHSACSTSASCSWVKGYTRKDGIKVRAHCKAHSGKASKAVKKTTKNKATRKADKKKVVKKKTDKKKSSKKKAAKKDKKKKDKKAKKK